MPGLFLIFMQIGKFYISHLTNLQIVPSNQNGIFLKDVKLHFCKGRFGKKMYIFVEFSIYGDLCTNQGGLKA